VDLKKRANKFFEIFSIK